MPNRKWAVGSNQYVKRPNAQRSGSDISLSMSSSAQMAECGISWDLGQIDLDRIRQSTVERATTRFRAAAPDFIWNAATMEGNTYTLPEVRTLLDGVTVEGKRLDEQRQILALRDAFYLVNDRALDGSFRLDKATSDAVHASVAQHEAIESGAFRGEGTVNSGGHVRLSHGGIYTAPQTNLPELYDVMLAHLDSLRDPREAALAYFAAATHGQFYFDGNKRTARLMMSGHLLAHGYDAINIPYSRMFEFNTALDRIFDTHDGTELMVFVADCAD